MRISSIELVEEIVWGVVDLPNHDEVDVDDILVACEHQALLGHIPRRQPATLSGTHADLDSVGARHLRQQNLLDRIWQANMQAGWELAHHRGRARRGARHHRGR